VTFFTRTSFGAATLPDATTGIETASTTRRPGSVPTFGQSTYSGYR